MRHSSDTERSSSGVRRKRLKSSEILLFYLAALVESSHPGSKLTVHAGELVKTLLRLQWCVVHVPLDHESCGLSTICENRPKSQGFRLGSRSTLCGCWQCAEIERAQSWRFGIVAQLPNQFGRYQCCECRWVSRAPEIQLARVKYSLSDYHEESMANLQ